MKNFRFDEELVEGSHVCPVFAEKMEVLVQRTRELLINNPSRVLSPPLVHGPIQGHGPVRGQASLPHTIKRKNTLVEETC